MLILSCLLVWWNRCIINFLSMYVPSLLCVHVYIIETDSLAGLSWRVLQQECVSAWPSVVDVCYAMTVMFSHLQQLWLHSLHLVSCSGGAIHSRTDIWNCVRCLILWVRFAWFAEASHWWATWWCHMTYLVCLVSSHYWFCWLRLAIKYT